jgi:hypothetical protein
MHSGPGLHTPASVHFGTAEQVRTDRAPSPRRRLHPQPERFNRPPDRPSYQPQPGSTHPATPPNYRTTNNSVSKILTGSGAVVRAVDSHTTVPAALSASLVLTIGRTPGPSRPAAPSNRWGCHAECLLPAFVSITSLTLSFVVEEHDD